MADESSFLSSRPVRFDSLRERIVRGFVSQIGRNAPPLGARLPGDTKDRRTPGRRRAAGNPPAWSAHPVGDEVIVVADEDADAGAADVDDGDSYSATVLKPKPVAVAARSSPVANSLAHAQQPDVIVDRWCRAR
jgi:hypothetical protein